MRSPEGCVIPSLSAKLHNSVGASASGKLADFDSAIPRFESLRPNHLSFSPEKSHRQTADSLPRGVLKVHLGQVAWFVFLIFEEKKKDHSWVQGFEEKLTVQT